MANFSRKNLTIRFWGWFLNDYEGGTGSAGALGPESKINSEQILSDITWKNEDSIENFSLTAQLNYLYRKEDVLYQFLPPGSTVAVGTDGNIFTSPTAGITTFTEGIYGHPTLIDNQLAFDFICKYDGMHQHVWRIASGEKYRMKMPSRPRTLGQVF